MMCLKLCVHVCVVPGGLTFASCADEDVPWSELFNSYGREMLTSSAHALRMDTAHVSSRYVHMYNNMEQLLFVYAGSLM